MQANQPMDQTARPETAMPELSEALSFSTRVVEKQIARLREVPCLRRMGTREGQYWEVLEVGGWDQVLARAFGAPYHPCGRWPSIIQLEGPNDESV